MIGSLNASARRQMDNFSYRDVYNHIEMCIIIRALKSVAVCCSMKAYPNVNEPLFERISR